MINHCLRMWRRRSCTQVHTHNMFAPCAHMVRLHDLCMSYFSRLNNCNCCSQHFNLWPSERRRQGGKMNSVNLQLGMFYTIHLWWNWQSFLRTIPSSNSENTEGSAGTVLAASTPGHAQKPHGTSLGHSECQTWDDHGLHVQIAKLWRPATCFQTEWLFCIDSNYFTSVSAHTNAQ